MPCIWAIVRLLALKMSGGGENRFEPVQRVPDIAFEGPGDNHPDRAEQRRATKMNDDSRSRTVLSGFDLAVGHDLDPDLAITVERHRQHRFVIHYGPAHPVGHALDLDDRVDLDALFQRLRQ